MTKQNNLYEMRTKLFDEALLRLLTVFINLPVFVLMVVLITDISWRDIVPSLINFLAGYLIANICIYYYQTKKL